MVSAEVFFLYDPSLMLLGPLPLHHRVYTTTESYIDQDSKPSIKAKTHDLSMFSLPNRVCGDM